MASRSRKQLANEAQTENSAETTAFEEVNVLVSAFNVFDGFTDNSPSWQIAISLPPVLKMNAAHPSRIRITVHPVPIMVTYEAVEGFVKETYHDGENCKYQLVVHLAVSSSITSYKLERRARRTGYNTADVSNKLPSEKAVNALKGSPLELDTPARLEDVYKRWQGQLPDTKVEISDDAGHYLAEYLYYGSLAELYRQSNRTLEWKYRTTICLLHVPPLNGEKELEIGRDVVTALIYALIDSRRQRNSDFDEPPPESLN